MTVTHGRLCVSVSGGTKRQLWSVDNWGDSIKAHQVHNNFRTCVHSHINGLYLTESDGNLAVPVRNIGPFGEGSSDLDIIRVKWKCHGSETSLLQCETEQTSEREPCEHDMDAGVRCYGE